MIQHYQYQFSACFGRILAAGRTASIFKFHAWAENKSLIISAAQQGASMMAHVESVEIFETTLVKLNMS